MKSLLALICGIFALGSGLQAASLIVSFDDFSQMQDGNYGWNIAEGSGSQVIDGKLVISNSSMANQNTSVSISGGSFTSTSGNISGAVSFSFSGMQASDQSQIIMSGSSSSSAGLWGLAVSADGKLQTIWKNEVYATSDVSIDFSQINTVTVSADSTGTKVYLNGVLVIHESGLKWSAGTGNLTEISFGGNTSSSVSGSLTNGDLVLENFYGHSGVMTEQEALDFYQNTLLPAIPEPSAAALAAIGLLSMLGVRRRRQ